MGNEITEGNLGVDSKKERANTVDMALDFSTGRAAGS